MNAEQSLSSLAEIEKEKSIINKIIYELKDELCQVLDEYRDLINRAAESDKPAIQEQTFGEIVEYFLKIIYRLNRFSEFKSRIRILKKGQTLSAKELERCDFVIKLVDKNNARIVKNTINEMMGKVITTCGGKKTKKRKGK
jgi:hypothetical protein